MITSATVSGAGLAPIGRLEVIEQEGGELGLNLGGRPVVAVRVADVDRVGHEWLERCSERADALIESAPIVVPW